jgi:glycosyltransferase involved in cell wall biosynthesis
VSAAVLAPEPSAGRSRRILLVESNEDGTVGGSYQAQFDLARLLDRAGFQPVVLFNQDNLFVARLRALGIEVHIFEAERAVERAAYGSGQKSRKFREMGRAILRRRRFLQGRHIDLLHLNNHPSFTCYDWLPAARLAGIPCVVNAMGDAEDDRLVSRALMRRYDRVIAISEFMRGRMLELGIPDRRITTVYLGLDAQAYRARVRRSPSEVRQELGVPADRVLVVMVGNLKFWKGQHVVLEALAGLPGTSRGGSPSSSWARPRPWARATRSRCGTRSGERGWRMWRDSSEAGRMFRTWSTRPTSACTPRSCRSHSVWWFWRPWRWDGR